MLLSTVAAAMAVGLTSTGDVCVNVNYKKLCLSTFSLKTCGPPYQTTGSDAIGYHTVSGQEYCGVDLGHVITTETLTYDHGIVIYRQKFPQQLNGTSVGDTSDICTEFPSFKVKNSPEFPGYLQYAGVQGGADYYLQRTDNITGMHGGLMDSGPLVLLGSNATMVISSGSEFMSHSQVIRNDEYVSFGVMGGVTSIPANFVLDTITVTQPDTAFSEVIINWGTALLTRYGKDKHISLSDFTTNYLGYSTDNGAYYYYNTVPNKNYQDTLIDIKAYTEQANIPIHHWLMDSWWYYKGEHNGVKNWTAMPSIFPDGIDTVYNKTQWPIIAHNRYWSPQTDYAKQNGGQWEFIIESQAAMPIEQAFWDWLLGSSKAWGLRVYEQDWLHNEFTKLNCTLSSATLARQWLLQMGTAASRNDLTIQYCMAYPRHIMQSVEVQAVSQVRASHDYQPGNDQWQPLGLTGILTFALGLKPSKDNFWTTNRQIGSKRYPTKTENYNRLQSAVATFSTGPVAISDEIGKTDVELVLKSCNKGGKLLAPDAPAMLLHSVIHQQLNITNTNSPTGNVWGAHSQLSSLKFGYLLASVSTPGSVYPAQMGLDVNGNNVAWEVNTTHVFQYFNKTTAIQLPATDKWSFNVWTVAPVLSSGMVFMGEVTKWVAASTSRFKNFNDDATAASVEIEGVSGEVVETQWIVGGKVVTVSCTIPRSATVVLSMPSRTCTDQ